MKYIILSLILTLIIFADPLFINAFEFNKISEFGFSGCYSPDYDGFNIQDDYLYAVNIRCFQIFHIEDDHSLTLLSDVNLYHLTYSVVVKDNFAYASTLIPEYVLYRFNIEDKYNPVLTDSLYLNSFSYAFINNNYVFVHDWDYQNSKSIIHIYDNETFDEITQIDAPQNLVLLYIKENIAFNKLHGIVRLYDISNPDSLQVIAQYDVNDTWGYRCAKLIQDTILVIGNGAEIEFWDISEPFDWEMINEIELFQWNIDISGDKMIVSGSGLRLFDISNLDNPVLLDYYHDVYPVWGGGKPIIYNNIVYWGAGEYGIEIFSIAENSLDHIGNYCTYGSFYNAYIRDNMFFVNSYLRGIHSFDISNLNDPQYIGEYLEEFHSALFYGDGDIIAISGMTDIENEIWVDIILNITEEGGLIPWDTLYIQALEPYYKEDIGFFIVYNDTLHKYILDSNNQLEEVATLEIPGAHGGFICFYDNIAYIILGDDLYVVRNIDTTDLELANTLILEDIMPAQNIGTYEHYLFISESLDFGDCSIFDISNPETPEYLFTINKGGRLGIDRENHLLFLGGETCSIYDLTSIEYNYLNEIYNFQNWSHATSIIPFKRNSNNYLLYLESTSASIYEYSTASVDEELQIANGVQLTNHPNPFSSSTTISFNIHRRDAKNAEIKIYNVKGQLVKCLECGESLSTKAPMYRDYSINWDGKDENRNQVPNGIYFCRLSSGDKSAVKKMLLLR